MLLFLRLSLSLASSLLSPQVEFTLACVNLIVSSEASQGRAVAASSAYDTAGRSNVCVCVCVCVFFYCVVCRARGCRHVNEPLFSSSSPSHSPSFRFFLPPRSLLFPSSSFPSSPPPIFSVFPFSFLPKVAAFSVRRLTAAGGEGRA